MVLLSLFSDRWRLVLLSGLVTLVVGCIALPPTQPPAVVEAAETTPEEQAAPPPAAIAYGLEETDEAVAIDAGQAVTVPDNAGPDLLFKAINQFIDRGQPHAAEPLVERLAAYPLTVDEKLTLELIRARLLVAANRPREALEILAVMPLGQWRDPVTQAEYLTARATAEGALGLLPSAVANRLWLDSLAQGAARVQNQRELLELLQRLSALDLTILKESIDHPDLAGWIALGEIMADTTPAMMETALSQWRLAFPHHSVAATIISSQPGTLDLVEYQQVALLLPMTSAFGGAAQAFHDGFMAAYEYDSSFPKPRISVYDVGDEPGLSALYYRVAKDEGADFIVGPLGRAAVEALLDSENLDLNTLVIADLPQSAALDNLYGISLAPEREAAQVARKAFADGHRQAAVLRIEGEWGHRVADAFIAEWEAIGGTIVRNTPFPKDMDDYSDLIQDYLGIAQSRARYQSVRASAGVRLRFTPRRSHDMDLIFLAANAGQARLVVPQLRFFHAHDLPMYGTSYIYSGIPDPGVDADLDGVVFGDMRWMLEEVARYRARIAEQKAQEEQARQAAEQAALAAAEAEADAAGEVADNVADNAEGEVVDNAEGNAEDNAEDNAAGEVADNAENNAASDLTAAGTADEAIASEAENRAVTAVTNVGTAEQIALALENEVILALENGVAVAETAQGLALPQLARPQPLARPYSGTTLDRLFALGLQSYEALPRLVAMRQAPQTRYPGMAMTISVDQQGGVVRHPVWARFEAGLPTPLPDQPPIRITP